MTITPLILNSQSKHSACKYLYVVTMVKVIKQIDCNILVIKTCCKPVYYATSLSAKLPAALQVGQNCQCRYRVFLPSMAQSPSSWRQETCMQLPEAVVLSSLWSPRIKIDQDSSQPVEKPPPRIFVPRRPEVRKILKCC